MSGTSSSGPETWTDLFLRSLGGHEASRTARVDGVPSIPRYEIRERVGEGATAVVYKAWDRELQRTIALKALRGRAALSPVMRERFQREAQASAGLDHPHVVRVHDAGEHQGDLYLVLEFVAGRPLSQILLERRLPEGEAAALLEKVARGVSAAHANGIVHRDLKPGNILVTHSNEPKVGDFGLAHLIDSTTRLTQTGSSLGTPLYMAPEQVEGRAREITPRTDVYALGAMLYELLTGTAPHQGATAAEIFRKILDQDPVRPRTLRPGISKDLEKVALKALEKEPRARYPSAREFADELGRFLRGEPVTARTPPLWARAWRRASRHRAVSIAIVAVAVAAGIVGLQARERARRDQVVKRVQSLLESARPGLERAESALYAAEVPYATLVDHVRLAQAPIEEALKLAPDYALTHHRMGELWEIQGYYDRAESSWRKAREVDPSFVPAHFRLGRVLVWRAYQANLSYVGDEVGDRNAEARRLAEEASREIEAARKEAAGFDSRVQSDMAAAMTAYLAKETGKVTEACQAAIARHAGQRGAEEFWWLLCLVHTVRAEKLRCVNQAIALRPKFPLALYSRAILHSEQGSVDRALQDYDRVIELCPTFAEAYVNRGSVRFRAKDAKGATEDFEALIRMGRRQGAAYNGRGRTRFELQGDLEGGLADLTEAIRLMPNHYLPRQSRANLYLKMGEYDKCIADTMASSELRGDLPSVLTRFRARSLKGDAPGALEDGRVFLALAPKDHAAIPEVQKAVEELARKLEKK